MTNLKEKINAHLPIILQLISTTSLAVIALSAICGSKSLKQLAGSHNIHPQMTLESHSNHHAK